MRCVSNATISADIWRRVFSYLPVRDFASLAISHPSLFDISSSALLLDDVRLQLRDIPRIRPRCVSVQISFSYDENDTVDPAASLAVFSFVSLSSLRIDIADADNAALVSAAVRAVAMFIAATGWKSLISLSICGLAFFHDESAWGGSHVQLAEFDELCSAVERISSLQVLDLSSGPLFRANPITRRFCELVSRCPQLVQLSLTNNCLNEEGIMLLAHSLSQCTQLQVLDLSAPKSVPLFESTWFDEAAALVLERCLMGLPRFRKIILTFGEGGIKMSDLHTAFSSWCWSFPQRRQAVLFRPC
jgi:hypothetical protein